MPGGGHASALIRCGAATFGAVLRVSEAVPQYYIDPVWRMVDPLPACTEHPSGVVPGAPHGKPVGDSEIAFLLTGAGGSAAVPSICPEVPFILKVSFPDSRMAILSASTGTLTPLGPNVDAPDPNCPNRVDLGASRVSATSFSVVFQISCAAAAAAASGEVGFKVTSAAAGPRRWLQNSATFPLATAGCPTTCSSGSGGGGSSAVSSGMVVDAANQEVLVMVGVGQASAATRTTLLLGLDSLNWTTGAPRPCPGNHMGAAVVGNQLYLLNGFSRNRTLCHMLQIYSPWSDSWAAGPAPPFATGAGTAVAIGRSIYYCGGLRSEAVSPSSNAPVTDCARYDVDAGNWTAIAPMPFGVHHAAGGWDGKRMWIFGGRQSPGSALGQDVDFTQVYDPETNTWESSVTGAYAPLPVARGGMGAAVYMENRFYVMGGERGCRANSTCANASIGLTKDGVFSRIDRYGPATNSWDLAPPGMPLPRQGMYPVIAPGPRGLGVGAIYVCGGSPKAGGGFSSACQYLVAQSDMAARAQQEHVVD
ncbi:hypothetical protein HXX76_002029 [Chlamydomonas incerta]|uniref:Uncharacterized protein n=1 Tax=Chlamydomonas incerta TaxID=51695 RepID=A0A835WAB0_CHLIN|nr:hypothetical protein HXX76_002029 [Chlamydomonas incerta]|eukprot:KAG2443681.1 hypothetical protein HXX76_002029 [Chlamydomonas incerta]